MSVIAANPLEFELPPALAAGEPPEARGLGRDDVRLMVQRVSDDSILHTRFASLPDFLQAGDVLVVNTSATINAAFPAIRIAAAAARGPFPAGDADDVADVSVVYAPGGINPRYSREAPGRAPAAPATPGRSAQEVILHLSTPLSDDRWVVELRRITDDGSAPLLSAEPGETIDLPARGRARLIEPYNGSLRLWIAQLTVPGSVLTYAAQYGRPIRYGYVGRKWPLSYYQTMFAREPGSAEMPSAGRAFTTRIVTRLERKGVEIVPIVLHAGVSSLDADESPFPERYRVPRETAARVNQARAAGARVIAVGTTVVRALETVGTPDGRVRAGSGWTDLVISPEREFHAVSALLTGLHAPKASHLSMLAALVGRESIACAYEAALRERYLWHEFGDLHLILP